MDATPLQRALSNAPQRATGDNAIAEREFFCFRLGNFTLGVPSENVREVLRMGILTPLPRMAAFVMGVVGHRGEVLPVVDLLRFFGKGESRPTSRSRLFVGISGRHTAAIVADSVIGLQRIPVAQIVSAPLGGDSSSEHIAGVVRSASGVTSESMSVLNFAKLLQSAHVRAVQR